MSNNINDKMKEAVKKSTFNNQSSTPINATNKKKDTINFNNVIKNLSTSPNTKPWYKKKASIIGMSSTLGVGVLATAIAVPIVLTSQSSSTVVPSKPLVPFDQALKNFAALPLKDTQDANNNIVKGKISIFNQMVSDNYDAIATYWKRGGIYHWTQKNIVFPTSGQPNYDKGVSVITLLTTYMQNIENGGDGSSIVSTFNSSNLMNNLPFKAQGSNVNNILANVTDFLSMSSTDPTASKIIYVTFYNNFLDYIENIEINGTNANDLSFVIKFNNNIGNDFNNALWVTASDVAVTLFHYKVNLNYDNVTFFPEISTYISRSILNIIH